MYQTPAPRLYAIEQSGGRSSAHAAIEVTMTRDLRLEDDHALDALGELLRRVDACPAGLVENARAARTWPLGEAELAALLGDAAARD
jgi:hypothetical protein